ncbi:Outer membrane protein TolC [wastewater metagenome]|uniref:Outer membrane protein TolC n=2 Tax=unclassified sequences TaxID=12908 RepID=A0A5B8RD44_9ZZZZ|nr:MULTISPECIES: TolC family outer membrane protein [Arhodomonas]MCS4503044.1 TolC family outer membrane protein [Arhodomonas aquaeolei]QEA06033.1 outer membrane protein TolC [uncultured organism]
MKRILLAVALGSLSLPALAAEDLLDVYRNALDSDPVFQQAQAQLRTAEEALPQARALRLPEIGVDAAAKRNYQDTNIVNGPEADDSYNSLTYGVQLSQPLFRYSDFQQLDVAKANVAQAKARFASAEQSLMTRAAERYFGVLDAQVALAAARAQLKAIQRQLEQARERFDVGLIARTDVEEAKARYDTARASVIQAEDDLESARAQLREVIGKPPGELARVRSGVDLSAPQPADEDAWRQRAEEQNWELTAARQASKAAMENVDVARGGHYPQVDAVASYGGSHTDGGVTSGATYDGSDNQELAAGIEVTVPLYTGGATSSRVREAQSQYTEARASLEEVRRSVTRNAADAYRGVQTALERVQALAQSRVSTKTALEATQAGFEVGTRTIVDVLDAQQNVFEAERNYQQARHAYLLNTLRLQQAAGVLSEDDLASINRLLSANAAPYVSEDAITPGENSAE